MGYIFYQSKGVMEMSLISTPRRCCVPICMIHGADAGSESALFGKSDLQNGRLQINLVYASAFFLAQLRRHWNQLRLSLHSMTWFYHFTSLAHSPCSLLFLDPFWTALILWRRWTTMKHLCDFWHTLVAFPGTQGAPLMLLRRNQTLLLSLRLLSNHTSSDNSLA